MTGGRPRFVPPEEQCILAGDLAAYGFPQDDIAKAIGVDAKTLRRAFKQPLKEGKTRALAKVAQSLYRKATGDGKNSVAAGIFILKTQGGWKETQVQQNPQLDPPKLNISFADGGPGRVRRVPYEVASEEPEAGSDITKRHAGVGDFTL
jgi:hypothetical protein